jgi:hypothetical protein
MSSVRLLACFWLAIACGAPNEPPRAPAPTRPVAATSAESPPPAPPPVKASFEVVMVDDSVDRLVVSPDAELPAGVTLFEEHPTWSLLEGQPDLHAALLRPKISESLAQMLVRIEPWLRTFPLSPDARFGWEELEKPDEATGEPVFSGWRSYILYGAPVLTGSDIASVKIEPDWQDGYALAVRLTPNATERFRIATRDHRKQRMAITLQGLVLSAPIIESEIRGGQVQVSLGSHRELADAERFAKLLTGAKE